MKIVITGSSSGIGRSLSASLLSQGHSVWGLARSDQGDFAAAQPNFRASRCDVAEWSQVALSAAQVSRAWGSIDALIACAGLQGEIGPIATVDPLAWSSTVRANLDGTFYSIRAFFSLLRRGPGSDAGRAKIICLSGGGSTKARANFSAYGAAKTAIVRLVENLAEETKDQPLDVNAIAPGAINTRLTEEVLHLGPSVVGKAEYQAALKQKASGGGSIEKVQGLVNFLLSPASDGISGRLLSAPWDPWATLASHREALSKSDIYTLRRILPEERKQSF
jgi:3-oxoacyl-[acyl-carrier protein] reductase